MGVRPEWNPLKDKALNLQVFVYICDLRTSPGKGLWIVKKWVSVRFPILLNLESKKWVPVTSLQIRIKRRIQKK